MLEEFKRIGKYLFQEGLVDSHGGNMSVRQGDRIFITRRDAMLGDLKEGDIVEIGLEPGEGDGRASRELPAHRALYRQTRAKAIVHAHPAHAIAVSLTDNKVVPQDAEGIYLFKSAPIVRVREGVGSEENARLLPSFLSGENVVAMLRGHGSFAIGGSLEEAYKYTSSLEKSCQIIIAVRSSGGRPVPRERTERKHAIPPGIGVMDRSRYHKR
jgi:L-fuculose-phosphate aldolase